MEKFLSIFEGIQILVKEKNCRKLDPIKKSLEYEYGLTNLVDGFLEKSSIDKKRKKSLTSLALELINEGEKIKEILKEHKDVKGISKLSIYFFLQRFGP